MVRARAIYKRATEVDTKASTYTYRTATEQLDDIELLEQTPPTTPKEPTQLITPMETETGAKLSLGKLSPGKKKPGPHNLDQAAKFVIKTTKSIN